MPLTSQATSTSPQISPHPEGRETRLIDQRMLHYEASIAGFAERYGRGETSHTIHVWWARRPHSAMRALVFASLCKDTSDQALELLKALSLSNNETIIEQARRMIASQYEDPPRVLDMFGGGGTIPFEASNLGAATYAIDANELSVFIQRCNLIDSQKANAQDIIKILRTSGQRVLLQLTEESASLFPLRKQDLIGPGTCGPLGYIWTYTKSCDDCGYKFHLSRRRYLSKKNGKSIAFVSVDQVNRQLLNIQDVAEGAGITSAWPGRNGTVECPRCKAKQVNLNIQQCEDTLVALVNGAEKRGKDFIIADSRALPCPELVEQIERDTLAYLNAKLPSSALPVWSGIVNAALYGIESHADFLNHRQRAVLLLLIKALTDEYQRLIAAHDEHTSRYIIGVLSSLIDQLVDWNCRLSMWIPQNEQVGRAFCGPGVPMLWDYCEIDPVMTGPANLWSKLERITAGVQSIKHFPHAAHVQLGYAQELPFPDSFFEAIVTDPPYYDNIYYNVLADFFFAWKRILLGAIAPDLFSSDTTDNSRELVASRFRSTSAAQAHEDYCEQLSLALREANRVLKANGVFSFVYSHSSLQGWEALVRAFRATNFRITSVQPLSIERKQRPRAMTSEAVNTCITFVAHHGTGERSPLSQEELKNELRKYSKDIAPQLLAVNWSADDTALAVFANAVAMIANADHIAGANDREALRLSAIAVAEEFHSFKITDRKSL
jgi:putative DNA methylase